MNNRPTVVAVPLFSPPLGGTGGGGDQRPSRTNHPPLGPTQAVGAGAWPLALAVADRSPVTRYPPGSSYPGRGAFTWGLVMGIETRQPYAVSTSQEGYIKPLIAAVSFGSQIRQVRSELEDMREALSLISGWTNDQVWTTMGTPLSEQRFDVCFRWRCPADRMD